MFKAHHKNAAENQHSIKIMYKTILLSIFFNKQGIWAQNAAFMTNKRNKYKILVGKFEGKTPLGKSVCSSKSSFKNGS